MQSIRVVVTRRLPPAALSALKPHVVVLQWESDEPVPRAKLLELVRAEGGAHAILCLLSDTIDAEIIEASPRLKGISTMSAGYNHVSVPAAIHRGIRIGYTPGVLTEATADLTLALVLATARHVTAGAAAARNGDWTSWKPMWLTGKDLFGSTVGIIGLGRIGIAVARRLSGFKCKVLYSGGSGPKPDAEAELLKDAGLPSMYRPLEDMLRESDIVIMTCALNAATRNLMTYHKFCLMKSDALFCNVSRGETVVQPDLIRVLRERPDMLAGLDVTTPEPLPLQSELFQLPNCLVLPHIGSASTATRAEMARIAVENAIAAAEGRPLLFEVPESAAAAAAAAAVK